MKRGKNKEGRKYQGMYTNDAIATLESIYNQIYSKITSKKISLSQAKYDRLYELYDEEERKYQFALGEETQPEYGEDELNDLLDDVCAGLA